MLLTVCFFASRSFDITCLILLNLFDLGFFFFPPNCFLALSTISGTNF